MDNDNELIVLVSVLPLPPDHLTLNRKTTQPQKIHPQVACSKDFDLTLQDVEMESLEVWEFNWKGIDELIFVDDLWWL